MAELILKPNSYSTSLFMAGTPSLDHTSINEVTGSYDDADYINQTGGPFYAGFATYYIEEPPIGSSGTINEVRLYARCRGNTSSSVYKYNVGFVIGGSIYSGTITSILSSSFTDFYQSFANNPATSGSWVWSDFNSSINIIINLTGAGSADNSYCSALFAKVVYSDSSTIYSLRRFIKTKQIP